MKIENEICTEPEWPGIGLKNESSLHSAIKNWYAKPGDRLEVKVDGYIIDIVRGAMLIEIQTGNFASIRDKLSRLLKNHDIRLVHPIPVIKNIIHMSPDGSITRRRKSPKHGNVFDIFNELVSMPNVINEDNFTFEALMICEDEIICDDGKGSWRRRGASVVDRRLTDVTGSIVFKSREDFLRLLPDNLSHLFTNKELSAACGITISKAQRMTYCLKKMGAINEAGKLGKKLLYEINR